MNAKEKTQAKNLTPERIESEGEHLEIVLPNGSGRITAFHPFKSLQIICYDLRSRDIPDLWELGFRRGGNSKYFRTLVCRKGSCEFSVNGVTKPLRFGQAMIDHAEKDNQSFSFSADTFTGIEIKICIDEITKDNILFKMLGYAIQGMTLPTKAIFESNGYIIQYSRDTEQALDKIMLACSKREDIMVLAHTIEIVYYLCKDIERLNNSQRNYDDKQQLIADDIYTSLTYDFGSKWTARFFAEKYGLSDTTVKKYFKNAYGYGFKEYQTKIRMEQAEEMLRSTDLSVCKITELTGYSKQTKFTIAFKNYFGTTPLKYRGLTRTQ